MPVIERSCEKHRAAAVHSGDVPAPDPRKILCDAAHVQADQLAALELCFGASADLVVAASREGVIAFLNPAARARWPEAVGQDAVTLLPPESRAELVAITSTVLASGGSARIEWGERGPEGVRSWFHATVSALRRGDVVIGYVCVSSDAVELKRSEERLRRSEQLMVDTQGVAHLGTWEWDVSQPAASWSDELYRIYGLTPETYTPSYEAYLTMVHADDRQRVIDATNAVFHEHIPYSHDERIFRPDGSMRYLHTWAHPVLDEQGTLRRLVGVCQDITDQKLAEHSVKRLNQELEQRVAERTRTIETSMRDLEAFNAMVSHDLRAPLSVIQMSAELIMRDASELPPKVVDKLTKIRRSVGDMTTLVEDLLALARVGQAALQYKELDLSATCRQVATELAATEPQREVELVIAPNLRCTADAGLIRIAISNLLGNAWKYSSQRTRPCIEIGTTVADGEHALFVRDNGVGFDMSEHHRLFSPFERLTNASAFSGTGVGLATVHRIVDRHGGRIWATSTPDAGATFYLTLPSLTASSS